MDNDRRAPKTFMGNSIKRFWLHKIQNSIDPSDFYYEVEVVYKRSFHHPFKSVIPYRFSTEEAAERFIRNSVEYPKTLGSRIYDRYGDRDYGCPC